MRQLATSHSGRTSDRKPHTSTLHPPPVLITLCSNLLRPIPWGLRDHVSLEGLQEELEKFEGQEVVASILDQGTELREFARDVEEKLRLVELESIQDYISESDNLVALHDQIRLCDSTLVQMEALLGGFQVTSTSHPRIFQTPKTQN